MDLSIMFLFAEGEEGEQGSKVAKVDGTGAGEEVDSITKASLPASRRACCICYSLGFVYLHSHLPPLLSLPNECCILHSR